MPVIVTATEYLEINSVALATPAWRILDLTSLMEDGEQRGQDTTLPGSVGVLANPRRRTETVHDLPIEIWGELDNNGVAYSNPRTGLLTNIDYLNANVVTASGGGTRAATWHLPDGSTTRTAAVFARLTLARKAPTSVRAVLSLTIPAGKFT